VKIKVSDLTHLQPIERIIVHGLDYMLYQVLLEIDGHERLLYNDNGTPYRCHGTVDIRDMFAPYEYKEVILRQSSAYDEMIGQPSREAPNTLEVPLFWPKESV